MDVDAGASRAGHPTGHAHAVALRFEIRAPMGNPYGSPAGAPQAPAHRQGNRTPRGRVMTLSRAASTLSAPDRFLMRRLNRWRPPRWFRVWMLAATRAGDGWLWWCCGLAVLISGDAGRYRSIGAAGTAVLAGIGTFKLLKRAVG